VAEPRIRVSAILRWRDRILLCRHSKHGRDVWLLPGGGVQSGESLVRALRRELWEETRLFPEGTELPVEGPIALVDSIAPESSPRRKHVVHVIFAADVLDDSLEGVASEDDAVGGHRLFTRAELDGVVVHPPIHRFLQRWQPGDPAVYLGEMWVP
jgi:ADP-ribose pyrophosphatase YjhB (NUDIX family)